MAKNTGAFGLVFRVLNDNGESQGVRVKVTDDILLKKGQTLFLNDYKENIVGLADRGVISKQEAEDRINTRARLDAEYNQQTIYAIRAGKPVEPKQGNL